MIRASHERVLLWIGIVLLCGILLYLAYAARSSVYLSYDIDLYEKIGRDARLGADLLKSEYPPLVTALFSLLVAAIVPGDFPDVWRGFLLLTCLVAAAWTAWKCSVRESVAVLCAIAGTMLLLGLSVTWSRYDMLVGIFLLLTWISHWNRQYAMSGFFLMIAASLKLVPIALLPVLFIHTPKLSRKRLATGAFIGLLIGIFSPLVVLGPVGMIENSLYMLLYHLSRGVQVESTWSAVSMLSEMMHGRKATLLIDFRVHQNVEVWSFVPLLSFAAGIAALFVVLWKAANKSGGDFAASSLALLSFLIGISTVLSPQYITWFLPLLLMWTVQRLIHEKKKVSWSIILILCVACVIAMLTHWLYPSRYEIILGQDDIIPIIVLNLRNCLFFVLAGLCYFVNISASRSTSTG